MSTALNAGHAAMVDDEYDEAVAKYTEAIEVLEGADGSDGGDATKTLAEAYASRAAAHLKMGDAELEAVEDANAALAKDPSMTKAYLRKGMALFGLEEFASAKAAFQAGVAAGATAKSFKTWIRKCNAELASEEGGMGTASSEPAPAPASAPAPAPAPAPASAPAPAKSAVRFSWYQSDDWVTLELYAKETTADATSVSFEAQSVSVATTLKDGSAYAHTWNLTAPIDAAASGYTNLRTKIEIKLRKADSLSWDDLEGGDVRGVIAGDDAARPSYPTSSQKKVDWDEIERQVSAEKDEEGDPLNKLFQQIYANADEDTRRAMNKSFVESGGTVLSTNWSEVGSKTVEGTPPEGMEKRDWTELELGKKKNSSS